MGRTSKPVRILVLDEDLFNSPEVQALRDKGHPIYLASTEEARQDFLVDEYDLIVGRRAWYCDTKHLSYLEKVAIPHARARIANREKEAKKDAA